MNKLGTFGQFLRRMRSQGFGIVTALFIAVVLAALGLAIVTFSTTQHTSSALDVQGARAYQAARAGIEWALFSFFVSGTFCTSNSAPDTRTFALPSASTLSGFTVTVTCTPSSVPSGTTLVRRTVSAVACNIPSSGGTCPGVVGSALTTDLVQREVDVRF